MATYIAGGGKPLQEREPSVTQNPNTDVDVRSCRSLATTGYGPRAVLEAVAVTLLPWSS